MSTQPIDVPATGSWKIYAKIAPPRDPGTANQEPDADVTSYADYVLEFNLNDLPLLCRCKGVQALGECMSKKCYLVCYDNQSRLATTGVASKDFITPDYGMLARFTPNDPEILPSGSWLFLLDDEGCDDLVRERNRQVNGVNGVNGVNTANGT